MAEPRYYVLCALLGTGMPWSEQEEGMTFQRWAASCFNEESLVHLAFILNPGLQQEEFTTALPTRAGVNALVKPRSACARDHPEGLRPCPGGRLALRSVLCLPGFPPVVLCPGPFNNLNKLWVAVQVETPLLIQAANRESFFRPHPDDLYSGLFPSEEIQTAVKNACLTMLRMARESLTAQLEAAPPGRKHGRF